MIRFRLVARLSLLIAFALGLTAASVIAGTPKGPRPTPAATKGTEKSAALASAATPAEQLKLLKGFKFCYFT